MVKTLKEARALKKSKKWQKMDPYQRAEALLGKEEFKYIKRTASYIKQQHESFSRAGWKNAAKLFYSNE